jgi:RNA polymerase sigma-70 factor (ECF subfamily)
LELNRNDRRLVARLLAGDEATFNAFFKGYFPRLYRYALALLRGNADEARDVVQQTFCKAFERLDSYRGEASLFGWMCQILRNAVIDRARRNRSREKVIVSDEWDENQPGLLQSIQPARDQPDTELSRDQLLNLIQATLDLLPSHYGDVLELKYVDELCVKEIAVRLEIGPKAAESLLTRARNAFREAIAAVNDAGDLLPPGLIATPER